MPVHYVQALQHPSLIVKQNSKTWVFLAGGITGCPNWQSDVKDMLSDIKQDIILLNPRRDDFDVNDPNAAREQITWERKYLNMSDLISFWFAKETIQPIVLFELGRFVDVNPSYSAKSIVVGIHPEYPRRADVEIQVRLAREGFLFDYTLEDLVAQIKRKVCWLQR